MKRVFGNGRYANVMATLAVFIALGGSSYAALKLPANSVGTKQIKKNAVTSAKVKNGSLLSKDFKAGQLPAGAQGPVGPTGPQGPQGSQGAQGDPGSALAFARVLANGTLDAARTKGVTVNNHPTTGVYCLSVPTTARNILAQIDLSTAGPGDAEVHSSLVATTLSTYCPAGGNAVVLLYSTSASALIDRDFNVIIN